MDLRLRSFLFTPIALLPAVVVGQANAETTVQTASQCYTTGGNSSVNSVPTTQLTYSSRIPTASCVTTITPTRRITPPAVYTTITSTSVVIATVTAPPETDTIVNTTITTITSSITLPPATILSTVSTTVNYTRSLPDFTPVQSTLPQASLVDEPEIAVQGKRSEVAGPLLRRQDSGNGTDALPPPDASFVQYPQSVTCIHEINIYFFKHVTRIAPTYTTTLPPPTTPVFATVTSTITSTVDPGDIYTTIIDTSTVLNVTIVTPPPSTSTTTSTFTVTSTKVGASALCSPANFANAVGGFAINGVSDPDDGAAQFLYTGDDSPEYCCHSCAINPECNAFAYYGNFTLGRQCQIIQQKLQPGDVCYEGQYNFIASTDPDPINNPPGSEYTIGNGNCAFFTEFE